MQQQLGQYRHRQSASKDESSPRVRSLNDDGKAREILVKADTGLPADHNPDSSAPIPSAVGLRATQSVGCAQMSCLTGSMVFAIKIQT